MQAEQSLPVLKCKNIIASPRGLAEADGKRIILFVPASEVDHVVLKHGRAEHRPIVSLTIGIILALVGIFWFD